MATHKHPLLRHIRSWITGAIETLPEFEERHEHQHEDEAAEFLRRQERVKQRLERLETLAQTRTARRRERGPHDGID